MFCQIALQFTLSHVPTVFPLSWFIPPSFFFLYSLLAPAPGEAGNFMAPEPQLRPQPEIVRGEPTQDVLPTGLVAAAARRYEVRAAEGPVAAPRPSVVTTAPVAASRYPPSAGIYGRYNQAPFAPPAVQEQIPAMVYLEVLHGYVANNPKELTIEPGEVVLVLDNRKRWWLVENAAGLSGFVPSTFLVDEHGIPAPEANLPLIHHGYLAGPAAPYRDYFGAPSNRYPAGPGVAFQSPSAAAAAYPAHLGPAPPSGPTAASQWAAATPVSAPPPPPPPAPGAAAASGVPLPPPPPPLPTQSGSDSAADGAAPLSGLAAALAASKARLQNNKDGASAAANVKKTEGGKPMIGASAQEVC